MKPASPFAPGPLALAGLIVVAALTRLLPHPPNFSPVEAIALFGGAYFASKQWSMVVPLLALLVSDLALGVLHGASYAAYLGGHTFWSVYACIALSVVLGFGLRGKASSGRVIGYSLAGSVLFFLLSNFGVWLTDALNSRFEGLTPGDPAVWADALWVVDSRYDDPVGACAPV